MLASLVDASLDDPQLVYEPKYDGIRAIVEIAPKGEVRLWSRLGNEKTRQFPEIAAALTHWARARKEPLVLDGEIVALDAKGDPTGFQNLQGRIHLGGREPFSTGGRESFHAAASTGGRESSSGAGSAGKTIAKSLKNRKTIPDPLRKTGGKTIPDPGARVALIVFDLLRDGKTDYRGRPLTERRAALERLFAKTRSSILRVSRQLRGDGHALFDEALERGWEGLIAKQADSLYKSGKRTPDWKKLKIVQEQEFVVGGWTEPRHARSYFGALLLGVYEGPDLVYIGHTGTGFNEKELARVMKLLKPLETTTCPFTNRPKTNERPHWTRPELVAQIKFTEWTTDAKLRHPVYLGLRDDKKPTDVHREPAGERTGVRRSAFGVRGSGSGSGSSSHAASHSRTKRDSAISASSAVAFPSSSPAREKKNSAGSASSAVNLPAGALDRITEQLSELEKARRDGTIELPDGERLAVTNLAKVFWPKLKLTKGDLLRYYARVAPFVLPAVADRPLVMKRFPNGVGGPPFYQHRAPDVPPGVRTQVVSVVEQRPQIIGGSLKALLYMTQIAAISQDPWFSRVQHPEFADYAAFDLDPSEGVPFERALDVARWIRDELEMLGAPGVAKTSGADGLHIYVPLPSGTPYDAGLLFCQIVATVVAHKHPKVATVERAVRARGKRVYIDCLQNILGKTLATAYSARASEYAGVSTAVSWKEVDEGFDRRAFTIVTAPSRFESVGDVWAVLRRSKGVDLSRVTRYAERAGAGRLNGESS
jgi:bifunctional non-homologous end joining protein LigD